MLLASPKCISIYGLGSHKNEGFSDFYDGWVPFLLEIKQKAGWLVGMYFMGRHVHLLHTKQNH